MGIINEFNKVVRNNRANVALESEVDGVLTYGELGNLSDCIANKLWDVNGGIIAIYMEKSFNLIISIIGVLKSENAYLPLDISFPKERIEYMLEDANVSKILCSKRTADMFGNDNRLIIVDEIVSSVVAVRDSKERLNDLAYIIYTSGSTGTPKGVEIEHSAILNTIKWRIDYYGLTTEDKVLQIPSISFDSSVEDIFSTLLSGGTLVLFPEDKRLDVRYLAKQIKERKVTHILTVPSFYSILAEVLDEDTKLRFIVIAGEAFTSELVKKHYARFNNVVLYNEYGPTENSVCSTVHRLNAEEDAIYIGKAINNVEYIIYGKDEWGVGELWLTGKGLARGYHNDEEQTQKSFVYKDGKRYYKTGDYVKLSANGLLQFWGRKDQQIKINGMRFDLNEIDTHMQQYRDIVDSKTVLNERRDIITFFIASRVLEKEEIKKYLSEKIPKQFLPKKYYQISEFLRLPNGKVDIHSMLVCEQRNGGEVNKTKNRTEEKTIYPVICNIINKEFGANLTELDYELDLKESGVLSSISFIKLLVELETRFEFEFEFDMLNDTKKITIMSLGDFIHSITRTV